MVLHMLTAGMWHTSSLPISEVDTSVDEGGEDQLVESWQAIKLVRTLTPSGPELLARCDATFPTADCDMLTPS